EVVTVLQRPLWLRRGEGEVGANGEEVRLALVSDALTSAVAALAQQLAHPVTGMFRGIVNESLGVSKDVGCCDAGRGTPGAVRIHCPHDERGGTFYRQVQHLWGVKRPGVVTGEVVK